MKLDLKKFKKISSDGKKTVLKHADGHSITIAHAPLAPKSLKELEMLPLHKDAGGEVPAKGASGSPYVDPKAAEDVSKGATKSGFDPKQWVKNIKEGLGLADGGEVADTDESAESQPQTNQPQPQQQQEMVQVPKQLLQQHVQQVAAQAPSQMPSTEEEGIKSYNPIDTLYDLANIAGINIKKNMDADTQLYQQNPQAWMQKQATNIALGSMGGNPAEGAAVAEAKVPFHMRAAAEKAADAAERAAKGKFNAGEANAIGEGIQPVAQVQEKIASRVKKADGGEIEQSNPKLEESKKQPPAPHMYADGAEVDVSDAGQTPAFDPVKSAVPDQNAIPGMQDQPPQMAQAMPAMPDRAPANEQPMQQAPSMLGGSDPTLAGGYSNAVKGIEQQAAAQGKLGEAQAAIEGEAINHQQQQVADFQKSYNDLDMERKQHMTDIQNGHIDPDKYWDNHSKLAAGLGIIIAGFNPKGGPNQALGFINDNINRSIDAQAKNLQSDHNLLAANLHQFGNMKDAAAMTRVMMMDVADSKLKQAAATAASPMAKAAALKAIGDLQMQRAPEFMQLAMRRSLMEGGQGNGPGQLSEQDPAKFVPFVVPKEHQESVYKEVERAQDTRRMGNAILQSFDNAAKDNTILKTGAGLLRTPASVLSLHQAMQPTFKDLEGTVRQAAMDNTFHNITPRPGDLPSTIATKREALSDYLKSKASAPRARSFGIDLDKFRNSSTQPEAQFSPQQMQYLQWARQNPDNPKAQAVFKALGVK